MTIAEALYYCFGVYVGRICLMCEQGKISAVQLVFRAIVAIFVFLLIGTFIKFLWL